MNKLSGWKTIIGMITGGLVLAAWKLGWIDQASMEWAMVVIVPATGVSLRLGVKKSAPK